MRVLLPDGWPRPKGYSLGLEAHGKLVFVAGMIGWTREGEFTSSLMVDQLRTILSSTLDVLAEAGAGPEHIARMTWYITDRKEYHDNLKEIGAVWRECMGRNYPTMAVVEVSALMESQAKIEIESTAVVPHVN